MEKVDVTAIVPYYRDNLTIERAINSILNQTVQVSEIIIIDDFSNREIDIEMLRSIENKSNLIKIIRRRENRGPGESRNVGLDKASSNYIAFLDSDDVWKENKIEKQFKIMKLTNAFISGHKSSIIGDNVKGTGKIIQITPFNQFIKNRFPTRSVMIKNNNIYRFEKNKRHAEDFLLWTQMILNKEKAIIIDEVLANSFKWDFGDSGLTANLPMMYKGGISALKTLKNEKKINNVTYRLLLVYQTLKYILRIIRLQIKRLRK